MDLRVEQFVLFLMLFVRTASLFVSAPVFGHASIPPTVKIGLAAFLALVLYSSLSLPSPLTTRSLLELAVLTVKEAMAGATIGLAVQIIFSGVRFAGDLISYDMGFTMSVVFDPENGQNFPVLSEMLYWFLLMIFMLVNGHHFILEAVVYSYSVVPIGTWNVSGATIAAAVGLTGKMFAIAVKIAAPLLVSLFLANVSLGILNKVMPQMNIFSVMFPLKIGIGIIVLSATVPVIAFVFKKVLTGFQSSVIELIKVM